MDKLERGYLCRDRQITMAGLFVDESPRYEEAIMIFWRRVRVPGSWSSREAWERERPRGFKATN